MKSLLQKRSLILLSLVAVLMGWGRYAQALTLSPVRFELAADAGTTVNGEMILMNEATQTTTFYSSFANFEASGETGTPSFVEGKEGLATWMSTTPSVTLDAGESKIVPFSITVPESADPGGNFAAIFWGTTPQGDTTTVSIGAKSGVLVLLRVNGPIDEKGGIIEYNTKDHKKFFTSLPVDFYYRFQNSGNDRIEPEGDIIIKHIFGFTKARVPANRVEGNVLPQSIRKFEASWQSKHADAAIADLENLGFFGKVKNEWRNFAFGYYTATLDLAYGSDGSMNDAAKTKFWVIPWQLLLVIIIGGSILISFIRAIARRHNQHLMNRLRQEIKEEMAGTPNGQDPRNMR